MELEAQGRAVALGLVMWTPSVSRIPAPSSAAAVPGWSASTTGRSAAAETSIDDQARIASGSRFSALWTVANT